MIFKRLRKWLGLTVLLITPVFVPAGRVDAPMAWVLLGVYSALLPALGIVFSEKHEFGVLTAVRELRREDYG